MVVVCMTCSSLLLNHLADEMDGLTSQIDRQLLRETVRAFTLTNDDLGGTPEFTADVQHACNSCQVSHSLGHSPFHSLIHSVIHSFIHSVTHSLTYSCIYSLIHQLLIHSFIDSLIHSFSHSLTVSAVPVYDITVHPSVCLFFCLSVTLSH